MRGEDTLQSICIQWFKTQHPKRMILSIPNGALLGGNRFAIIANLKKTGLLKGCPDLFIPETCGEYHGFWIEMKTKKGKVSPEQTAVIASLKDRGYKAEICYSLEEFIEIVNNYFSK